LSPRNEGTRGAEVQLHGIRSQRVVNFITRRLYAGGGTLLTEQEYHLGSYGL